MTAVFSLVVAASGVLVRRWVPNQQIAWRAAAAVLGVVLIAVSARTMVIGTRFSSRGLDRRCTRVCRGASCRPSISEMAERPALVHAKAVNVNLPEWDEMWAAYFLEPKMRVVIR